MKRKKKVVLVGIVLMMFILSACSNGVDVNLNVKKGDKYNIHIVNEELLSVIPTNLQEVKLNRIIDFDLAVDVKEVDNDKNITLDYKYEFIKMSGDINGNKSEYDSKKQDNIVGINYSRIIGKGFTVKLDKKGNILDIKGADELINSAVDTLSINEKEKEQMKKATKFHFGDEGIRAIVKQTINYCSKNSIKVGDTWENKYNVKTSFPICVDEHWKFIEEKDGLLNLESQATLTVDTKGKPIDFMDAKANIKLINGSSKGSVNVSKENGFIQKGTNTQTMNGNIELLDTNLKPKNINFPMKVTSKVTCETTKK